MFNFFMRAGPINNKARLLTVAISMVSISLLSAAMVAFTPLPEMQNYLITIPDDDVPLAGGLSVLVPESPGTTTYTGGGAVADVSNAAEGYITIKYSGNNKKVKIQITKAGGSAYTYNLNSRGTYEVFPLTSGNGTYSVGVFENVTGNQYAQALASKFDVKLRDQTLPFLYPNQYVNFDAKSATIAKGNELAGGSANDLEIISNVYNYVTTTISYDTEKARTVQSGYLPNVDNILHIKKGICFDYAAVMTAMLRSQQIPTRLEVGYVSGGLYHAWISTYIKDKGWVNGVIQFDGTTWKLMDPTFASGGASPEFIGNGTNYQTQYVY